MKEALLSFLAERIRWHQQEQVRLRRESRADEAAHLQIAVNVYNIFLSTYQAMKYDLGAALAKFGAIMEVWNQSHLMAVEHHDVEKKFVEEIKIGRALEILRRAKELEMIHRD